MNRQQLLAQIAELRKVYRALGEITEPDPQYQNDIESAQFHIRAQSKNLSGLFRTNTTDNNYEKKSND